MTELANTVKAPYQYLGKDTLKIGTGYLIDQAVDLVKTGLFDGQALCDSNYVDAALFRDLFRTMNFAKVNDRATEYDADLIYGSLESSSYVKLSSAVFKYNYIVANAITDGLIDYNSVTNRLYDKITGGVWQNPYSTDYVFMFTAGQSSVSGKSVVFDLSGLIAYGNCSVSDVWIDFGDGDGYELINSYSNAPFTYSSGGTKCLKMKVRLQDNVVLESHTRIAVPTLPPSAPSGGLVINSDSFTKSYGSVQATCTYSYANGHVRAVKPLIYVEGFDHPILCELRRFKTTSICDFLSSLDDVFNNILNDSCEDNFYYTSELASRVAYEGYDFFYVNWENPEADIEQNAELLKRIIQEVNSLKPTDGSGERTVIVGHSMGGLIARCAILEMERDGQPHQVDCFVSQDVPHLGAIVPIGAQYALRDVHHCLDFCLGLAPKARTVLNKIVGVLDCDSARQMMYTYIDGNYNVTTGSDDKHQQFLSYLNNLGGFPKGDNGHPIENLTIVSGNRLDSSELSDELLTFGLLLAKLETLVTPLFPKTFSVSVYIDRDRQSGSTVSTVTVGYTHYSKLLTPVIVPMMIKSHTSPSGINHYDTVPGSYLSFGVSPSFWTSNPFLYINAAEHMVFVPTASSFCVSNYNADFYMAPSLYESECPFDSYCFEEDAMRHENSLIFYLDWIAEQRAITTSVSPLVLTNDVFSVNNIPPNVSNETWTSSDNSIASINNGVITVNGAGLVTFVYQSNREDNIQYFYKDGSHDDHTQYRYYSKHRRVLAGFPAMTLSHSKLSGNQYSVSAECTTTDQEIRAKLDELLASGEIKIIWGYKNSDNSYTWADTTSSRTFVCTAPTMTVTRVAMQLVNVHNGVMRPDSTISIDEIDRSVSDPFYCEPLQIEVSQDGAYPFYGNFPRVPSQYGNCFMVWINDNYTPAPSAPDNILVDNQRIPLSAACQASYDGGTVTVYVFNFMSSFGIQSAIASLPSPLSDTIVVPIAIRNGTTVLQVIWFPVYWVESNQPM